MSVARVNPLLPDTGSQGPARSAGAPGADFAAVARSLAAGDLEGAQKALAAGGASTTASAQTLAQTLAEGNLAAARLALAQLGVAAFVPRETATSGRDITIAPPLPAPPGRDVTIDPQLPAPSPAVPGAPLPAPTRDARIAIATPPQGTGYGMVLADVGATLGTSSAPASTAGGTVTSANGGTYNVADVLLALAIGNAGGIPADVINLYGPGGARYDPAAIMDAYRNSDLGKAQIAALSWMGRPA